MIKALTRQVVNMPTRRLVSSRTGQLVDTTDKSSCLPWASRYEDANK